MERSGRNMIQVTTVFAWR